ncbi:MAG: menaquinone biosynthesis protein [Leptospiraceae bacterium]|nr:menaquinone biosynthesis protein [Leptospiraceae bacterium]
MLRAGIVKHLNARPLTYGIENRKDIEVFYENPSVLKEELLKGNLDFALISSVECLRNKDRLAYSLSTGVCARERVRSILFYHNKKEGFPKNTILVDQGSRSSVALLRILHAEEYGSLPETISTEPKLIQRKILENDGSHLLFGDNALEAKFDPEAYEVIDLASWWNRFTKKHFCFALWAYPKERPIDEEIFYKSLEFGLTHLEEIIRKETRFSYDITSTYLKNELHYVLDTKDKEGFAHFAKLCEKWGV